ncbi:uncharacterized protein LOC130894980 isoform X1 [Diorhabda carinulata]|uniref:uncharacterized protein LOC130894980 isoform X1 n=2 Tax=Diorhabda carinulata TaxID=1163345 RepID=UPI0025A24592|nr:uncharacterized protein LOC130894980 isoform X1 [Diorhabda carinulata]XP_057658044.1 uncharacterized protein LOC130894980 isoform X1 [Diorhabda carinulata]
MSKIDSEEKSPLLFIVEDEVPVKNGYFEGRRFNDITAGATTVLTHFPNYISSCWIATALSALIFFMMILLVLSTITAASLRVPRCAASPRTDNTTIHLVHVHDSFHPDNRSVKFIREIMGLYPDYDMRLLEIYDKKRHDYNLESMSTEMNIEENSSIIENTSASGVSTSKRQKILKRRKEIEDAQMLLNMLLHARLVDINEPVKTTPKSMSSTKKSVETIEKLIDDYPKITYKNTTYPEAFSDSPLYPHYLIMDDKLKVFAIRVLQIWQYGGISFDIENPNLDLHERHFVIPEKVANGDEFEETVVVDEKASRLESKVACHAFFGQILMILRKADKHTTVNEIMRRTIKSFCKNYAAGLENCKNYVTV